MTGALSPASVYVGLLAVVEACVVAASETTQHVLNLVRLSRRAENAPATFKFKFAWAPPRRRSRSARVTNKLTRLSLYKEWSISRCEKSLVAHHGP